jgi:hypothetical protein
MLPILSKHFGLYRYLFIYLYLLKDVFFSSGNESLISFIIVCYFLGGNKEVRKYPRNNWHPLRDLNLALRKIILFINRT